MNQKPSRPLVICPIKVTIYKLLKNTGFNLMVQLTAPIIHVFFGFPQFSSSILGDPLASDGDMHCISGDEKHPRNRQTILATDHLDLHYNLLIFLLPSEYLAWHRSL